MYCPFLKLQGEYDLDFNTVFWCILALTYINLSIRLSIYLYLESIICLGEMDRIRTAEQCNHNTERERALPSNQGTKHCLL